jgi:ketosteroid isomerase-like protein
MKYICSAAVLFCAFSLAFCDSASNATSRRVKDEGARRQVLATDDRRIEALRHRNAAPLRKIYMDDYTLVTPSGVVRSKDEQIKDLMSGQVQYRNVETINRTVRLYGDVAIVLSYDILQAGQQIGGDIFFTRTYT